MLNIYFYVEASGNSSQLSTNRINELLQNYKWNNLIDVETANYRDGTFDLNQLLGGLPIIEHECIDRIKMAQVYLGCSYAYVLKTLLFLTTSLCGHCRYSENGYYQYNCIVELKNIVKDITNLMRCMKETMHRIDELNSRALNENQTQTYVLQDVFNEKGKKCFDNIHKFRPSPDNTCENVKLLNHVKKLYKKIHRGVDNDIKTHCKLVAQDFDEIWESTMDEHYTTHADDVQIESYKLISGKIYDLIHLTYKNRIENLGFSYDTAKHSVNIDV